METSRRLSIDSDGNVFCGHHLSEDFGEYLGNVYEQGLREIWHDARIKAFRRSVRAGQFDRVSCKLCGGEILVKHIEFSHRFERARLTLNQKEDHVACPDVRTTVARTFRSH